MRILKLEEVPVLGVYRLIIGAGSVPLTNKPQSMSAQQTGDALESNLMAGTGMSEHSNYAWIRFTALLLRAKTKDQTRKFSKRQ